MGLAFPTLTGIEIATGFTGPPKQDFFGTCARVGVEPWKEPFSTDPRPLREEPRPQHSFVHLVGFLKNFLSNDELQTHLEVKGWSGCKVESSGKWSQIQAAVAKADASWGSWALLGQPKPSW